MPIIARDNRREFAPPPEGLHQAVCVDVIELGLVDTPWGLKEKVDIRWQLDSDEPGGRPFQVTKRYTLSLNEKARLCQDLQTWRGKKFTAEERAGFDLERLLGVNCQVQVVHNVADDGRVYGNVQAIVPLGRGMEKIAPDGYTRVKDRDASAAARQGAEDEAEGRDLEPIPF